MKGWRYLFSRPATFARQPRKFSLVTFTVERCVYAAGLRQRRHSHDYSNITVVLGGRIDEATDLGAYSATSGSVVMKGAGREHEDAVGRAGARTLSIRFRDESPVGPNAWSWCDAPRVVRCALAVHAATSDREVEWAVATLVVALGDRPVAAARPEWIDALVAQLEQSYERRICLDSVARRTGMHPIYVARTFRRFTGMSMGEFVAAIRLRHARHALATTSRSIFGIAAETGFADASHLCRTFASVLGVTPMRFRRLVSRQV